MQNNNIIQVTYNDNVYFIDKYETLSNLLSKEELIQLPLDNWVYILQMRNGECSVDLLQKVAQAQILWYDKSSNVNSFIYNNSKYWLDKETRMGINNLLNFEKDAVFTLFLNEEHVTININTLKTFLENLELYSYQCYKATQNNILKLKELTTIEELLSFDFKKNYPKMLVLDV